MRVACVGLIAFLGLSEGARACDLSLPADAPSKELMVKPIQGAKVRFISGFGMRFHPILHRRQMHTGIDWAAPAGSDVLAAAAGQVILASRSGVYGNYIAIDHGNGWITGYAHLSKFEVSKGDCVKQGSIIGAVGATGAVKTSHLHYEVVRNGRFVDPFKVAGLRPKR